MSAPTFGCGCLLPPRSLRHAQTVVLLSTQPCRVCRTRRLVERQEANHARLTPESVKAGSAAYLSLFPEEED